ncbi:uncharacterized protein IAS62_004031 [Cryptococcus decagattii]|uniref:Transposase zinc-binding domain-containing protein n=1 Tax=Cryptococcus decagattii TaxID=1859122 RepID=A0ABZ2AVX0_9TREE
MSIARVFDAAFRNNHARCDHMYLFDHCRCPQCFHPRTKQRLKTLSQVPCDIHPTAVALTGFLRRAAYETQLSEHVDCQDE